MEAASEAAGQAPIWATVGIPAVVALLVSVISLTGSWFLQKRRLTHEFEMKAKDLAHTFDLQRERLKTELKLEFATEGAIRELLMDERYTMRSFEQIQRRLNGLEDDDLRKALIRAGAVSFRKGEKGELWGLRERNAADLWKEPDEA